MSSWTKVADETTVYTDVSDIATSYTEVDDTDTQWGAFGGLIHLATEGLRELMMTEGETDYIVVSKGSDGISWSDIADASTGWTKVIDA